MTTDTQNAIRPTKKQKELLGYIEEFIREHGYSPSYREIMNGLQYTSVATVSLHVNSLIRRGHLRKRDRSARSLEVVASSAEPQREQTGSNSDTKWLTDKVEHLFTELEAATEISQKALDDLHILVGSLRVLGLETVAQEYDPRLESMKERSS